MAYHSPIKATQFRQAVTTTTKTEHYRKSRGKFSVLVRTVAVLGICSAGLAAQEGKVQSSCLGQLSSLFSTQGWIVPGVEDAIPKTPRAQYKVAGSREGVFVTIMKPGQRPAKITRLQCSKQHQGAIEIQAIDVEALQLLKFDVNGKVFAYGVTVGWQGREDRSGRLVGLGTSEDLIFYDTKGTGTFELMNQASSPFVPEIPKWISSSSTDQ